MTQPPYGPPGPGPYGPGPHRPGPYGPPPGPPGGYPPQRPYPAQQPPPYRPGPPQPGPYPQGPGPQGPGRPGPGRPGPYPPSPHPPRPYPQGPPPQSPYPPQGRPPQPPPGPPEYPSPHQPGPGQPPPGESPPRDSSGPHGWSRSESTLTHEDSIRPRSGKLGDILEGDGQYGVRVAWRMHSIEHPADEVFAQASLSVPEGYTSAIVAALFTNKSRATIGRLPVEGVRILDTQGLSHRAAAAHLTSHPPMREGTIAEEETVAGHIYFLIPRSVGVRAIQWWPRDDAPHQVLTWLR